MQDMKFTENHLLVLDAAINPNSQRDLGRLKHFDQPILKLKSHTCSSTGKQRKSWREKERDCSIQDIIDGSFIYLINEWVNIWKQSRFSNILSRAVVAHPSCVQATSQPTEKEPLSLIEFLSTFFTSTHISNEHNQNWFFARQVYTQYIIQMSIPNSLNLDRTLAKPVANSIKTQAKSHPKFKAFCISVAQVC